MNFSADYGTSGATYARESTYAGITKFAKQLVDSERITGRFGSLFKEPAKKGRDLEVIVYKKATGVDYSKTNAPAAPFPSSEVLCFKQETRRTYPVKIDDKDLSEAADSEEARQRAAEEIVQTLYSGAFDEENGYIMAMFKDAQAAKNQIVDYSYQYNDTDTEKGTKELLKQIKYVAGLIRKGESSVNPKGLNVPAASVKMIIPLSAEIGIDVYARMGAYNEAFTAYGVDEVITYTPDEGEEGEIFIFDNEFAQVSKIHEDSYKTQPIAGCDNYDAYLHRYIQYAACPLFSCVRIKKKATPVDYSVQTVNANMYAETYTLTGQKQGFAPVAQLSEEGKFFGGAAPTTLVCGISNTAPVYNGNLENMINGEVLGPVQPIETVSQE